MTSSEPVKELTKGSCSRTWSIQRVMSCLCSGEKMRIDEILQLSESLSQDQPRNEILNIAEAESALRESDGLHFEEARALLGRYEYQKGNIEAALQVLEGIDLTTVTPKIKLTLARLHDRPRKRSQGDPTPVMSISAVSLLFEALFLKAKSLQTLGRFKEAAQSCKVIVDLVESSLPDGLPENFGADSKLQETIFRAVELLPELWKSADCSHDAILSYRRALLHHWNLDADSAARIQKEFAVYLLYSGVETSPPSLRSQMDISVVPQNSLGEAMLLLMLLLRKMACKVIEWDPSVVHHLSFALSISNRPHTLAWVIEDLPAGIIGRNEVYYSLALCYQSHGDNVAALNLLRKLLHHSEDPNNIPGLLLASKICSENSKLCEEGITYARRALVIKEDECLHTVGHIHSLLGMLLSEYADFAISDSDRVARQSEALQELECAAQLTKFGDPVIVYQLSLQYALHRKLDIALYYVKHFLKLERGTSIKGLLLLARILSAQKHFGDAERVIEAALDQTVKWEQEELLRTKAKLQIAQGCLKKAIGSYTLLLAVLQVKSKSFGSGKSLGNHDNRLELQTWLDLASIYISLSLWKDAEICLTKVEAISPYCASTWYTIGSFREAKGLYKQAQDAFNLALTIDPSHVPSLISSALVLRRLDSKCNSVIKSLLMNALKYDRTNHVAWYNLGLVCKSDKESSVSEAVECFQAAATLEETAPVEPFR